MDFKKPSSPILTPQDLMKYINDPKYCHEDIESSSALKHGVSVLHIIIQVTLIMQLMCAICPYSFVMKPFINNDICESVIT